MNRWRFWLVLLAGPGSAVAAVVPPPGSLDARVREIEYRENQVVQIAGYVGYHIHLQLAPDETFVALGAGDAAAVDIAAEGPHVMLKPKAARVATNLTLVSSRRVYHFEYRTYEAQPSPSTAIFALRFRYPQAPSEVTPAATTLPFSSTQPVPAAAAPVAAPVSPVNTDYWYCGSPWLQPTEATDDGVQTRLTFNARGEWPAIFVRNADGTESLVNFHADGTSAVIHRVAKTFVLRRGQLVGCVENRGYAGSGNYRPSGTTDPGVVREVKP